MATVFEVFFSILYRENGGEKKTGRKVRSGEFQLWEVAPRAAAAAAAVVAAATAAVTAAIVAAVAAVVPAAAGGGR